MKIAVLLFAVGLSLASAAVVTREKTQASYDEVCYDDYGCFTTDSPWTSWLRPLAGLPMPPWGVGTRFLLFTRSTVYEDFELVPDNKVILADSPYDSSKKTVFLVHGFAGSHLDDWMVKARVALLAKEDINVISVDWSAGAAYMYLYAVDNSRMVGAQMVRMMDFLMADANLNLGEVRIVAHSIGAHAASYASHNYAGAIGHVTALDPTKLYFDENPELVKIDMFDATHVQVIHTDTHWFSGMGSAESLGHVDIFVNGGERQPGCEDLLEALIGGIINLLQFEWNEPFAPMACSHYRAADYYVESIESTCPFVAHKCARVEDYNAGLCNHDCSAEGSCIQLGYSDTMNFTKAQGKFFLNTQSESSFCQHSVQFETLVHKDQKGTSGKLTVEFHYSRGIVTTTVFEGTMRPSQILATWVAVPSEFMENTKEKPILYVKYSRGGMFDEKSLSLETIKISTINEQLTTDKVLYNGVKLDDDATHVLYPPTQ